MLFEQQGVPEIQEVTKPSQQATEELLNPEHVAVHPEEEEDDELLLEEDEELEVLTTQEASLV